MRYLIALLICFPALAQEPRGREDLPTVAADDVDNPALYQKVVTPITVRQGEAPIAPDAKRVVIHARPVWRVADDGALAPVSTAVESGIENLKAVWRADANTVRFRVTEDGVCIYRAGQHVLRVRPARVQSEATDGSDLATADQVKPTDTTAQADRVVQAGSFSGVRFEHIVEPGAVKEIAWLDSMPTSIETARWFVLAYSWTSATLTPGVEGEEVLWKTAEGKTVLRWPAPIVTDATGKELRAQYRIRPANPDRIVVLVNAGDLRAATYPVGIDPTTTTVTGDNLANRSIRTDIASSQFKAMYYKLTMPTMSGNVVTDVTVDFNAVINSGPMNNLDIYARATADTGAWDDTTGYAALDALTMGTAVSTGNTLAAGTGWKTLNVFGDSTKGASKFYTDNPGGGSMTICLKWSAWSGSIISAVTLLSIGDGDLETRYADFSTRASGASFPRVTVTYTAGTPTYGSFFFGN
jgi:hypothetical protein